MAEIDALRTYFENLVEGIKADASEKGQKIPTSFRFEVDASGGKLFAPDYFKYLIYGRGPGKFPPPDATIAWIADNPQVLERAKQVYKYITEQSLGYLIGRKIAREGTDIYTGKKKGIELLGVMEKNLPELLETLAKDEAAKISTSLQSALK